VAWLLPREDDEQTVLAGLDRKLENRVRLLIVSREYPPASEGGIARRLSCLVPRLLSKGIDVDVVCFGGSSLHGERIWSLCPHSRILYTHSAQPSARDATSILTDIWRLDRYASRILSSGRYDLVQVEDPVFGPFISSPVPKIVTVHTTQLGEFKALLGLLRNRRQIGRLLFSGTIGWAFDRISLNYADIVIAVGQTIRNELLRSYRVPDRKVRVVPNGVDVPGELNKLEAKKSVGVDGNRLLLLYAGRLIDRKRVDDFIWALHMLRQKGLENFSGLVVGSGPSEAHLKGLISKLGLSSHVKLTGYVNDDLLFHFLEAADVFVLPSCYEGHPISVMEAMAYGCLPIVADIPQMHEIVQPGRSGIIYPVGELESLTGAILEVASDDEKRRSLSIAARESAKRMCWSTTASDYVSAYEDLVVSHHVR